MICKACGHHDTDAIEFAGIEPGWRRCRLCGSDSNYGIISTLYITQTRTDERDAMLWREIAHNVNLLTLYRGTRKTFLDVGCNEGTALRRMASLGWECHGWDVVDQPAENVRVGERFAASEQYDCVMCREVVEHSPDAGNMVGELVRSLKPQGVLQIQTPRPLAYNSTLPIYQSEHVAILSPLLLREWGESHGLIVLDSLIYAEGQCWTWQRPG